MAVVRLVAMVSGRTMRGVASEREFARVTLLQQDHVEVLTSSWRRKPPCMFDANARVVRCGGAASTTATNSCRDAVLEEDTWHSWPDEVGRMFAAEADVGRVECSGKGCRPVYEEEASTIPKKSSSSSSSSFLTDACLLDNCLREDFASHAEIQIRIQPQFEPPNEKKVPGVQRFQSAQTPRSFELAMQEGSDDSQHLSEFAIFSWKSLGDKDKAEELYQEALDHASFDNTEVLASYASFLWQCDQ